MQVNKLKFLFVSQQPNFLIRAPFFGWLLEKGTQNPKKGVKGIYWAAKSLAAAQPNRSSEHLQGGAPLTILTVVKGLIT